MGAFARTSLEEIIIPDGVSYIGDVVFLGCTKLTSITIPNSVTSVGYMAFRECFSLTDVYFTGTEAEWAAISIGDENNPLTQATIHYNYTPE